MSTIIEIERAIERLPHEQLSELRQWLDEHAATTTASASVFSLYDEEEGEGQQWVD